VTTPTATTTTPVAACELLATAEAALEDAAAAYRDRASASAEPVEYSAWMEVRYALRHVGVAVIATARAEALAMRPEPVSEGEPPEARDEGGHHAHRRP